MKRLPPQKRNQLALVIVGSLAAIGMIYFFLIGPQNTESRKIAGKIASEQGRLEQIKATIKMADATAQTSAEKAKLLSQAEKDVASGDLFAWTYDTIRQFKADYHVDIPSVGQPVQMDVDLIPDCPYKQIKFSIVGTGYYHDIGKFLSDLENKFPHMRAVNLLIDQSGGPDVASEKLSFRVELIALVKPSA